MAVPDSGRLLDELADGVVVHDPETGEILQVNAACRDLLGHEESRLVGGDLADIAAGGSYLDGGALVREVRSRGSVEFEWRVETAAGEHVPVEVRLALATRDGRELGVATLRETTDDNPYHALFENGQFGLWEVDLSDVKPAVDAIASETDDLVAYLDDNPAAHERLLERVRVVAVNEKALEVYGADSKAELKSGLDQLMTEQAVESWKRMFATVAAGGTTYRAECTTRTFDRGERTVLTEMTVPETHADDYERVYLTALDITERKERERELERKNAFLDAFASVVSHDIATPLGVIENKARLIELTEDPAHAADIYDATQKVRDLIDELHDLARQGKEVGETAPVDLGAVAREAWRSVETAGGTLSVESTATLDADRDRLRELLENLLSNAVEHGGAAGGGVDVRVGTLDGGFYVADDGPGLDDENRDRAFERGYTTDENGTGLGLAIVRRIAEGHGWTVEVTGSDDGGARFEIRTGR